MTGSTTFVVHIPGALEPLAPASPEFIKANVYVPGTLLREFKKEKRANPVPDIVQIIIREMGVSTVERFDRARKRQWNPPRNASAPRPHPLPDLEGMPLPIPENSSRYTFYGRRLRSQPDPISYFDLDPGTPTATDEDDMSDYVAAETIPDSRAI